MAQSLYNISKDILDLINEIEINGGEVTDEDVAKLEITKEELKDKLSNYRHAYAKLTDEVDACKKEEARLKNFRKVKENTANRLKSNMLNAVLQFGDIGKTGNRVVNLSDCKLYTKKTYNIDIDDEIATAFTSCFMDGMYELYKDGMIDKLNFQGELQSMDVETFIASLNANFKAEYPELAAKLEETKGHLFTINDLMSFKVEVQIPITFAQMITVAGYSTAVAYFDNEDNSIIARDIEKSTIGNLIKQDVDITFATRCESESLIIK